MEIESENISKAKDEEVMTLEKKRKKVSGS